MILFDEAAPVPPARKSDATDLFHNARFRIDRHGRLIQKTADLTKLNQTGLLDLKLSYIETQTGPGRTVEKFRTDGGVFLNRVTTDTGEVFWMPARK